MVGIKNMDMPKSCEECKLSYYEDGYALCCPFFQLEYIRDDNIKRKDCPLVEIKIESEA